MHLVTFQGMLQCALYVKSVLEEKRILEQAFTDAGEVWKLFCLSVVAYAVSKKHFLPFILFTDYRYRVQEHCQSFVR